MGTRPLISILMVFLIVIILTPSTTATTANVVIDLEHDDIIFEIKKNDSRRLTIKGEITCHMDGFGTEVQYVEVFTMLGDRYTWLQGCGPYRYRFESNGTKNFTIDVTIPADTENRTTNRIVASGRWEAELHPLSKYTPSGEARSDDVNITVIRWYYPSETPDYYDQSQGAWYELSTECIVGLIFALIPVIIIVIYYMGKRKSEDSDMDDDQG